MYQFQIHASVLYEIYGFKQHLNTMKKLGSERTYLAKLIKDQKFNKQIRINKLFIEKNIS